MPKQPKGFGKKEEFKDKLLQLWPTPIQISQYEEDYSKELAWCRQQEFRKGKDISPYLNVQSEDTFILDQPELWKIKRWIESKIDYYISTILQSSDELHITQSWLNISGHNKSHTPHTHTNSLISGVWYPSVDNNNTSIELMRYHVRDIELEIKEWNTINSSIYSLPLVSGQLLLFPSSLVHGAPANLSGKERLSLAFNTWPKGNLGNERHLNYLPLNKFD